MTPGWHSKVKTRYTADGKRIPGSGGGPRKLKRLEEKALGQLGLDARATKEDITRRYKLLVKQNHPDANGGDRSSEQRLQQILTAYKQLKQAGLC